MKPLLIVAASAALALASSGQAQAHHAFAYSTNCTFIPPSGASSPSDFYDN